MSCFQHFGLLFFFIIFYERVAKSRKFLKIGKIPKIPENPENPENRGPEPQKMAKCGVSGNRVFFRIFGISGSKFPKNSQLAGQNYPSPSRQARYFLKNFNFSTFNQSLIKRQKPLFGPQKSGFSGFSEFLVYRGGVRGSRGKIGVLGYPPQISGFSGFSGIFRIFWDFWDFWDSGTWGLGFLEIWDSGISDPDLPDPTPHLEVYFHNFLKTLKS